MLDIVSKIVSIILLDLILSGDNAVVIALATRKLPKEQQRIATLIGTGGAIIMRVLLMMIAIQLLALPYVRLIGSLLLLYIAYDLVASNSEDDSENIKSSGSFFVAIRTIILADLVMSVDNVIAIAGVSSHDKWLAVFGLVLSIPIIIFASKLILELMERFPIIVWIGALLIAYTAGKMFIEDKLIASFLNHNAPVIAHNMIIPIVFCGLLYLIIYLFSPKNKVKN